jgi:hypothetical protein
MAYTYQYFRLVCTSALNSCSIAEWKFFDGSGSQIATTGGTASANQGSGNAANAFDGNTSTWSDGGSTPSYANPYWIQYQFASAVTVGSFSITSRNDGTWYAQAPQAWSIQGSNDGSTWTTIGYYSAVWTGALQTQTFTLGAFGLGVAYRLLITADAVNQNTTIAEWNLYDGSGTLISTPIGSSGASSSGGAALASTTWSASTATSAADAFDGSASTFWNSASPVGHPTTTDPEWLAYLFSASAVTVGSFSITARNDGSYNQAPSAFSLQSSSDLTTWTTLQTYTATWTSVGQVQTFGAPVTSTITFRRTRSPLGARAGSRQRTH